MSGASYTMSDGCQERSGSGRSGGPGGPGGVRWGQVGQVGKALAYHRPDFMSYLPAFLLDQPDSPAPPDRNCFRIGRMTMRTLVAAVAVAAALASSSANAQTRPGAETAPGTPTPQTAPAPPPAQAPQPTPGPTFRSGVDLITIDVGVIDGRGRPVDDLGAAEFSVKIDGEVRRVVSAELVKVDVEAAKKQVADKSETYYTSNLTPPNGRQIVIAVDQMHIRPGSVRPIMAAASRFLDRLSPLDQVAFIVFPEPGP